MAYLPQKWGNAANASSSNSLQVKTPAINKSKQNDPNTV